MTYLNTNDNDDDNDDDDENDNNNDNDNDNDNDTNDNNDNDNTFSLMRGPVCHFDWSLHLLLMWVNYICYKMPQESESQCHGK